MNEKRFAATERGRGCDSGDELSLVCVHRHAPRGKVTDLIPTAQGPGTPGLFAAGEPTLARSLQRLDSFQLTHRGRRQADGSPAWRHRQLQVPRT